MRIKVEAVLDVGSIPKFIGGKVNWKSVKVNSVKCHFGLYLLSCVILGSSVPVVHGKDCFPPEPDASWVEQTKNNGGRQGANRVVYSPIGIPCGGVQGAFSKPLYNIGDPKNLDSPNPYVGLQGAGVQIDAGIKWEAGKGGQWVDNTGQIHTGGWWTIFMNISTQGCRIAHSLRPALQIPAEQLGDTLLVLSVHGKDGLVDLEVDNYGDQRFIRNKDPHWNRDKNNYNHIKISGIGARRVIAMTQGKGVTYDGSWIKCNFSGGGIGVITGRGSDGAPILDWRDWTGPDNKNARDYNPRGAAHEGDLRNYEGKQWAVDFGHPFTRNFDGSHPKLSIAQENQRYANETVYIRLLKPIAQVDRKNAPQPARGH